MARKLLAVYIQERSFNKWADKIIKAKKLSVNKTKWTG